MVMNTFVVSLFEGIGLILRRNLNVQAMTMILRFQADPI